MDLRHSGATAAAQAMRDEFRTSAAG